MDVIEKMARAVLQVEMFDGDTMQNWLDLTADDAEADASLIAQAAYDALMQHLAETGQVIVPFHATPKMCEAGLFANGNALLMSASCVDMANSYEAMIAAAKEKA
jgi:hypothetical protein